MSWEEARRHYVVRYLHMLLNNRRACSSCTGSSSRTWEKQEIRQVNVSVESDEGCSLLALGKDIKG